MPSAGTLKRIGYPYTIMPGTAALLTTGAFALGGAGRDGNTCIMDGGVVETGRTTGGGATVVNSRMIGLDSGRSAGGGTTAAAAPDVG